jgi:hypothetical protein
VRASRCVSHSRMLTNYHLAAIQSLLDALEALRLSQADKELRAAAEQRLLYPNGQPPVSNSNGYQAPLAAASGRQVDNDQASMRSFRSETELSYAGPGPGGISYAPGQSLSQVAKAAESWPDDKKMPLDDGGIYFQPVDPITKLELIDPVLADDGCMCVALASISTTRLALLT